MSLNGAGSTVLDAPLLVTSALSKGSGGEVSPGSPPSGVFVGTQDITMGTGLSGADATEQNDISLSVSQARQTTGTAGTYTLTLTYTVTSN